MNEISIEGIDENNINEILNKWNEINKIVKELAEKQEVLKTKIKIYLKERQWKNYKDDGSGLSVSIIQTQTQRPDIEQLKRILTESQFSTVMHTQISEKMMITTPESRERMNKFVTSKNKK